MGLTADYIPNAKEMLFMGHPSDSDNKFAFPILYGVSLKFDKK